MYTLRVSIHSYVSFQVIAASGEVLIHVMVVLCQRVLHGLGVPVECILGIVVLIFERNGDIMSCNCHRTMNLLEHGYKVVAIGLWKAS